MSGGHYPAYSHSQSAQEFIGSRHRLPRIPAPGPTSRYNSSISPAHGSSSSWMNKQNYSSKVIGNTYCPRNYSPASHNNSYTGEWSKSKSDTAEAKNKFSTEQQQESMDLSSHAPAQLSKTVASETAPSVNGDASTIRAEKKMLKNLNGAAMLNRSDTESEVAVSVMKSNPLKSTKSPIRGGNKSEKTSAVPNLQSKPIIINPTEILLPKRPVVPFDKVESVLESMFHSESKPSTPTSVSIIASSQLSKVSQESVEKILKSPSPMETQLSPEAALQMLEKSDEISFPQSSNASSKSPCIKKEKSKLTKGKIVIVNSESESMIGNPKDSDDKIRVSPSGINDKKDALNIRTNVIQTNEQDCSSTSTVNEKSPKLKQPLTKKCTPSDMRTKVDLKECAGTSQSKIKENEVESELAKMFAGIIDTENCKPGDVSLPNDSHETIPDPCQSSPHITPCEDSMSNYQPPEAVNKLISLSFTKKPNKKKSSKKSKSNNSSSNNSKTKQSTCVKENSIIDSTTAKRVPVIHIEGSKVNPTSVQIVNSIKLEEEDATDNKLAAKRKTGKKDKANKRLVTDYVLKNYDPCMSDASWVCIFCKLSAYGPWISGEPSGDLFGPYFIRDPSHLSAKDDLMRQSRPSDYTDQLHPVKKKQKCSLSVESNYLNTSSSEQKTLEIWAHENCFVWASGVHLVGSKLIGLEEAVWDALKTTCSHCGEKGASIGCKARHCKAFVHYGCAGFTGWSFDPQTFITTCNIHKVPD